MILNNRGHIFKKARKNFLLLIFVFFIFLLLIHKFKAFNFIVDKLQLSYSTNFFLFFETNRIKLPSLSSTHSYKKAIEVLEGTNEIFITKDYLKSLLNLDNNTISILKHSHTQYVEYIEKTIKKKKLKSFSNIHPQSADWNHYKNSKGIVLTCGGDYSWLCYLNIKQIRAVNCKLKIEVFIFGNENYDPKFCDLIKKYNAYCNLVDEKIHQYLSSIKIFSKYQFKILAIFFSKFENLLLLDLDNIIVKDIEHLFTSIEYLNHGLVLWPDAWERTTSPFFYEIADINVKENKLKYSSYDYRYSLSQGLSSVLPLEYYNFTNSLFHDFENTNQHTTIESGAVLVNKSKHLKSLMLTLYYNILGPDYYYLLFTLNSAGQGDKETFLFGPWVMNQTYFIVPDHFEWIGNHNKKTKKFESMALGHFDLPSTNNTTYKYIFMHLSYPKYFPHLLLDKILPENHVHVRLYTSNRHKLDYDLDLRMFQFFVNGMCNCYYDSKTGIPIDKELNIDKLEYIGDSLSYVKKNKDEIEKLCQKFFLKHLAWLKNTTTYKTGVNLHE